MRTGCDPAGREKAPAEPVGDLALIQLNRKEGRWSRAALKRRGEDRDALGGWFIGLLTAMLIDRCSDHLPFAVILDLMKPPAGGPANFEQRLLNVTAESVEERLANRNGPYRCYLEAFKLTDARIPGVGDERLRELARERFAPLLGRWVHE